MDAILAPPSAARITQFEEYYSIRFPEDYKEFLRGSNGAVPREQCFSSAAGEHVVERFLPLIENLGQHPVWDQYDLSVVTSQLDARLADGSSDFALQLIPIAELFAGDFLVLDYRANKDSPRVAIWDHEASKDFAPVTHPVCATFSAFLRLLHKCQAGETLK